MVAATASAPAAKPTLLRYWTTSLRDYNGRLPADLSIRIEWLENGVTRSAVGGFTGESIDWLYGSLPPDHIDELAIDCAVDCGESADVFGATFEGVQALGAMCQAVEATCLGCGARVESIDHLSREGWCSHCFVARMGAADTLTDAQIEALLGEAIANENVELVDLCETALKPIVSEGTRRQAVARIAEILARKAA